MTLIITYVILSPAMEVNNPDLSEVFAAIAAADKQNTEEETSRNRLLEEINSLLIRTKAILEPFPITKNGGPETNKSYPHKETPVVDLKTDEGKVVSLRLSESVQCITPDQKGEEPSYKTYGVTIEQVTGPGCP